MLNKAIQIATRAHNGQVDQAGQPYILHPLRVMLNRETELEQICAVLHDVIEDSDITLEYLRQEGFSQAVITAVDCLTKRAGESYDDYIGRILTNETACRVKLADLLDNMNLTRIANPSEEDKAKLRKYELAADRIDDVLPMLDDSINLRVIRIDGCVCIQPYMNDMDFLDRFIAFVEMHGWTFGGSTTDVTDEPE